MQTIQSRRRAGLIITLVIVFLLGSFPLPASVWAETGAEGEAHAAETQTAEADGMDAGENGGNSRGTGETEQSDGISETSEDTGTVWDGNSADTAWYTEHTGDSSYTIRTAAELAGLAKLVNEEIAYFEGKTVTLAADIDLAGDPSSGKNPWTPIGTETEEQDVTAFLGTFDGAGHTVSGIYVSGTANGSGFFGTLAGEAELKNLTVSGTVISNDLSTSGLVGRVPFQGSKCLITDCVNNCSVTSSYTHVGGVIGYNGGCDIVRCVNNGAVVLNGRSGNTGIGGVVGSLTYGDVDQCVNTGSVTLNLSGEGTNLNAVNAGGIAGLMNSESADDTSVTNSYNRGDVSNNNGKTDAGSGGIVGKTDCVADIHNSYSTGVIRGTAGSTGGIVGLTGTAGEPDIRNTYYLENTVNGGNGGVAGAAAEDETNGTLARSQADMKTLASSLGTYYADDTEGSVNSGYPVLKWQIGQSVDPDPGTGEDPDPQPDPEEGWDGVTADVKWYTGHESETSYIIETPEQLAGLAQLVKEGESFAGKQILLGADIDLNGKAWTPIGAQSSYTGTNFTGTFDGQYHTVSNFTCNQNLAGLFSILAASSCVKNLGIADAQIVSSSTSSSYGAGAVAAMLKAGNPAGPVIENCWTEKDVSVSAEKGYVGGIAGQISGYGGTAPMISGCVNNADVSSAYAGGILGSATYGNPVITNCYNTGVICCLATNSMGSAGGILGTAPASSSSASVSSSYNTGTVMHITSSQAEAKTGAVCGVNGGNYSDVYYLTGSCAGAAGGSDRDGITGLDSDALKAIATILNLNQTGVWTTDASKNNGYPILAWQADIPSSAPSVQSLKIAEPPTKTSYGEGEYLDLTGMKVVLVYSDGSEKELTHYPLSPDTSTMLTPDVTEFTINCSGFEVSQSITVTAAAGIRIVRPPAKTVYISGERFDDEGMVVELTYGDGTSAVITDYELSPDTGTDLTGSDEKIIVSYGEYSTEQPIHVKTPVGIRIVTMPEQTEYKVGKKFSSFGMKTCIDFNDGTSSEPSSEFRVTDSNADLTEDMTGVEITSREYSDLPAAICPITVIGVEKIEVTTPPNKTVYEEGEKFDEDGMVVTLVYKNGDREEIDEGYGGYEIVEDRKLCRQDNAITLTYDDAPGLQATVPITVNHPDGQEEPSLKITKKSSFKDVYREGDSFSSSHITVEYLPGDGESITLSSSDYEYSPRYIEEDTEFITVTYGGLTVTEPVNVDAATKMQVTGPTKTVYNVGDVVNNSGITVKLLFSEGSPKTLSSSLYTRTPDTSTPLTAEDKEIVFRFGTRTVSVPITVLSKVSTVTSSSEPGMISMPSEITLSTETEGATIYYTTDGSDPTTESDVYTAPLSLSGDTTVKAIAVKDGMGQSDISTFIYVKKGRVADVTADTPSGKIDMPAKVTLSTPAEGATIYYTTDGSDPTTESAVYAEPVSVTSNTTLKAIAVKEGFDNSRIAEFSYWRDAAAAVTASPEAGTISMPADITLSSATEGATIYYMTDGSDPTTESAVCSGPIHLTDTTTIKAIAVKDGFENSETAEFTYTKMGQAAAVTASPEAGTISMPADITLSSATEGATIYYMTDGSDPTTESAVCSGPIHLTDTTTIKAIAVKDGFENSEIAEFTYTKRSSGGSGGGSGGSGGGGGNPSTPADPDEPDNPEDPDNPVTPVDPDDPSGPDNPVITADQFEDLAVSAWYYDAVKYAVEKEWMNGVSESAFAPADGVTRGMFVTVLGRISGIDTSQYDGSAFGDVSQDSWYAPYVQWASENSFVQGVGEGQFAPDRMITRQEMAVLIYRYRTAAQTQSGTGTEEFDLASAYTDADSIAGWATEAVAYCTQNGLVQGKDGSVFDPAGTTTRAEMAVLLQRLEG